MHKWIKSLEGEWFIFCEKENKQFSIRFKCFQELGLCMYCGEHAKKEIENRKKAREEEYKTKELKKLEEIQKAQAGTLSSWI